MSRLDLSDHGLPGVGVASSAIRWLMCLFWSSTSARRFCSQGLRWFIFPRANDRHGQSRELVDSDDREDLLGKL